MVHQKNKHRDFPVLRSWNVLNAVRRSEDLWALGSTSGLLNSPPPQSINSFLNQELIFTYACDPGFGHAAEGRTEEGDRERTNPTHTELKGGRHPPSDRLPWSSGQSPAAGLMSGRWLIGTGCRGHYLGDCLGEESVSLECWGWTALPSAQYGQFLPSAPTSTNSHFGAHRSMSLGPD